MYILYQDTETIASRATSIVSGRDSQDYNLTGNERQPLTDAANTARKAMNSISQAATPCFQEGKLCQLPEVTLPNVTWPTQSGLPKNFCGRVRTMALDSGCISKADFEYSEKNRTMPICSAYERGAEVIFLGWKYCSEDELTNKPQ